MAKSLYVPVACCERSKNHSLLLGRSLSSTQNCDISALFPKWYLSEEVNRRVQPLSKAPIMIDGTCRKSLKEVTDSPCTRRFWPWECSNPAIFTRGLTSSMITATERSLSVVSCLGSAASRRDRKSVV